MTSNCDRYEEGLRAYHAGEFERAFGLLVVFAERGDAEAQCMVGTMFQLGFGVPMNEEAAEGWYLKAAVQGYAVASNNLGTIAKIRGNEDLARWWYEKAAEHGFPHSPRG
jgi:TPR repeat protein